MNYTLGACLVGNSTGVPECVAVQRRLKLIVYGLYNKLYREVSYRTAPIELSCPPQKHWADVCRHRCLNLQCPFEGQPYYSLCIIHIQYIMCMCCIL